jgi:DNA-binding response OmpR family regulator
MAPAPQRPRRILHAEDQELIAQAVAMVLRFEGFEVDWVGDGEMALARLQPDLAAYDLLLTDSNMPNLGGLELVRQLRDLNFPGRIVVLSGYLNQPDEAAYRALDVDGILAKPFKNDELLAVIERALSRPRA